MSDEWIGLAQRLVVGRKRDGRCIYDERAKLELVTACRRPGVSVAAIARACGVNANQVGRWLREQEQHQSPAPAAEAGPAFVAMRVPPAPGPTMATRCKRACPTASCLTFETVMRKA